MIDLTFNMSNGDCEVITDDENMIMSCIRRLDTRMNTTLYDEYGSKLSNLLGLRKTDVNLEFLNQTVNECLSQDERVSDCSVNTQYTVDGFKSDIKIVYMDNILEFTYDVNGVDE